MVENNKTTPSKGKELTNIYSMLVYWKSDSSPAHADGVAPVYFDSRV
jgi:hypothetical protein